MTLAHDFDGPEQAPVLVLPCSLGTNRELWEPSLFTGAYRVLRVELRGHGATPYDLTRPGPVDAAILQANHRAYAELDFRSLPGCRVVLDGRNVLDRARVEAAGLTYLAVGRAAQPTRRS